MMQQSNVDTVYKLETILSGKIYIGITNNFRKRIKQHKLELESNKHFNSYLQNYYNKYEGNFEELFNISVLENCELSILPDREKYYINHFKSHIREFGFNLTLGGEYGSGSSENKKRVHREFAPEIYVYKLDGTFINKFRSSVDAAEYLNFKRNSVNNAVHRGIQLKGYLFYKEPRKFTKYINKIKLSKGKIYVFNINKNLLEINAGMIILSKKYNININGINSACRRLQIYNSKYYFVKERDLDKFKLKFNIKENI